MFLPPYLAIVDILKTAQNLYMEFDKFWHTTSKLNF